MERKRGVTSLRKSEQEDVIAPLPVNATEANFGNELLQRLLGGLNTTCRQEPFQDFSAHVPPQSVPIKQIDKPHPAAVPKVLVMMRSLELTPDVRSLVDTGVQQKAPNRAAL